MRLVIWFLTAAGIHHEICEVHGYDPMKDRRGEIVLHPWWGAHTNLKHGFLIGNGILQWKIK